MSSKKGKIVDEALLSMIEKTKSNLITISKIFLIQLTEKIKKLAIANGIKGGLSFDRLKKAISKLQLKVKEVTNCGLEHMRSSGWNVNKHSFT